MRLASVWCVNCIRPWSDPHVQKKTLYAVFAEIKINAACVSVRWAIFKLMCNRSLNNEVIRRRILRLILRIYLIMAFCGAVAAIAVQKPRLEGFLCEGLHEHRVYTNFSMRRETFEMYLSALLFEHFTASHSSPATHICEQACWSWAVLAGNRLML